MVATLITIRVQYIVSDNRLEHELVWTKKTFFSFVCSYCSFEKENLDALLKKIITNREIKDTKNPQGLWVSVQLVEGDLKQVMILSNLNNKMVHELIPQI